MNHIWIQFVIKFRLTGKLCWLSKLTNLNFFIFNTCWIMIWQVFVPCFTSAILGVVIAINLTNRYVEHKNIYIPTYLLTKVCYGLSLMKQFVRLSDLVPTYQCWCKNMTVINKMSMCHSPIGSAYRYITSMYLPTLLDTYYFNFI